MQVCVLPWRITRPTAPLILRAIVREIDNASLGVCLDLTNSFAAMESADEILENLAPFTISVHLKEFTVERLEYLMGFRISRKTNRSGRASTYEDIRDPFGEFAKS